VQAEQELRSRVAARPELAAQVGGAWDAINALTLQRRIYRKEFDALERGQLSELFSLARGLVRYGDEIAKPNGERLREFSEARLPQFRQRILAKRPIYDEFEIATLTWSLTKMREQLGPDHPLIKQVFGLRSPAQIATETVQGSRLKELQTDASGNATGGLRKALLDGGPAVIAASHDPMIELARAIDPAARAIRKKMESEIDGPLRQQQELLARARLAVYGDGQYPDATFTLRLSYGAVQGYVSAGQPVAPFTQFAGAYARHTGADPFALPASWLQAKAKVNMNLPLNFVTSNDIIGGNSGSPMVNRDGEVVGLVFDGNIESLGGEYGFDASVNRTVAVDSAALVEALGQIYGAKRLVDELTGKPTAIKSAAAQ
jgi:hypothetical protein